MQLEGHGSYWKAKILKIQEIQFFVAVIEKKKRFFLPELPRVTLYDLKFLTTYFPMLINFFSNK